MGASSSKASKRAPPGPLGSELSLPCVSFDLLTPMLVVPFSAFKAFGRIPKSTAEWRQQASRKGHLVPYTENMIVIFVSHAWWERDAAASGQPDSDAPDYRSGSKKGLKHHVITLAIKRLIAQRRLDAKRVHVWIDYCCIR